MRLQFHPKLSFLGRTRRQFFETRNDQKRGIFPFLGTKKADFPFLGTKKVDFPFLGTKKEDFTFLGTKKEEFTFLGGKNPFLVEKNCSVRPRKAFQKHAMRVEL